jgi:hypothetical protein
MLARRSDRPDDEHMATPFEPWSAPDLDRMSSVTDQDRRRRLARPVPVRHV